jgi:ABC-2 type transport system ATP-binding protein
MNNCIELNNVSLSYRILINKSASLKEFFKDSLKRKIRVREFAALNNISFSVAPGEVLAILGKNGAGKSSLLKLLAGVLPPTSGEVITRGSIAPMIELGAGFHPEMTGAENVKFYSALMGRDIKNIEKRIDDIGSWAGVADHMDLPIRTFSSGMISRLAFSVATDQLADIILVDEVLSVGDIEFQDKSAGRMREMISSGAAVVLVSHDTNAIRRLATKALWIDSGQVMKYGDVEEVTTSYENSFYS